MEFFEKYKTAFRIFVGCFIAAIVCIALMNTDDFMTQSTERKVEVEDMSLQGYRHGRQTWQLQATYAWSSFSLDHPVVEHISNGKLYDDGRLVLQDLSARIINVNVPQERLFADRGVRATLLRQADKAAQPVRIWAEQLQYFSAEKRSYIQRLVRVNDGDNSIEAVSAAIDHAQNTVAFDKDWVLRRPGTKVVGKSLIADINKQACRVEGSVAVWHSADKTVTDNFRNQDTKIFCDVLELQTVSRSADMTLTGHVRLLQKDKLGYAERARGYEATDTFILAGQAGIVFERTDWLLEEKTAKKIKQQEARQLVAEKLTLEGDTLQISTRTKDVVASGNVSVKVKQKQASAESAYYDSKREVITLSGNVRLKKEDGSLVNAQTVIVDVPTERFEALGQAESTIILSR